MMRKWRVGNATSGADLGIFEGETEQDALDAMAREAGYADYAESQREAPADPGAIVVIPADDTEAWQRFIMAELHRYFSRVFAW